MTLLVRWKRSGSLDQKTFKEEYGIDLWDEEKIEAFQDQLLTWYDQQGRQLPWRETKDPYKIWVSEIMLQQTQVQTVIPYYERFITTLPDVKSLAEVKEDQLLKLWEGLGYYSRVKNMQVAAQQIMEDWQGKFPDNRKDLESLRGIGPYTAGAIASIAFDEKTPAIDGNAMRVFGRIFEVDQDISKAKTKRLFEDLVYEVMSVDRPGDFNQAIMDVGATKSMPKRYETEDNPVLDFDASYLNDRWEKYPVKKKKVKQKQELYYGMVITDNKGRYLLEKRPESGLLADFWHFPLLDQAHFLEEGQKQLVAPSKEAPLLTTQESDQLTQYLENNLGGRLELEEQSLGRVNHVFSHRKWVIYLIKGSAWDIEELEGRLRWVKTEDFDQYPFPIPQQKMLEMVKKDKDNQ